MNISIDKYRILHIAPAYHSRGGGIYEVVENLSSIQSDQKRYEAIDILGLGVGDNGNSHGKKVIPILPKNCLDLFGIVSTLWFIFKKGSHYQVFHFHGAWSFQFLLTLPLLLRFRRACVYQPHGLLDPVRVRKSWVLKKIAWILFQHFYIRLSKEIIACSFKESEELAALVPCLDRISIIPNGISPEFFNKSKSKELRENKLLFLSQIIPVKNIESIIIALSILKFKYSVNICLDLYGYGDKHYISKLTNLSKKLGIGDNVIFKGIIDRQDRCDIYDRYKYFILPSLSENFAIVVVEALSRGCIVLTSNQTPWRNFWDDHLLITEVSALSIAETLHLSLKGRCTIQKGSEDIKKFNVDEYKWECIELSFLRIYQKIIDNTRFPMYAD